MARLQKIKSLFFLQVQQELLTALARKAQTKSSKNYSKLSGISFILHRQNEFLVLGLCASRKLKKISFWPRFFTHPLYICDFTVEENRTETPPPSSCAGLTVRRIHIQG